MTCKFICLVILVITVRSSVEQTDVADVSSDLKNDMSLIKNFADVATGSARQIGFMLVDIFNEALTIRCGQNEKYPSDTGVQESQLGSQFYTIYNAFISAARISYFSNETYIESVQTLVNSLIKKLVALLQSVLDLLLGQENSTDPSSTISDANETTCEMLTSLNGLCYGLVDFGTDAPLRFQAATNQSNRRSNYLCCSAFDEFFALVEIVLTVDCSNLDEARVQIVNRICSMTLFLLYDADIRYGLLYRVSLVSELFGLDIGTGIQVMLVEGNSTIVVDYTTSPAQNSTETTGPDDTDSCTNTVPDESTETTTALDESTETTTASDESTETTSAPDESNEPGGTNTTQCMNRTSEILDYEKTAINAAPAGIRDIVNLTRSVFELVEDGSVFGQQCCRDIINQGLNESLNQFISDIVMTGRAILIANRGASGSYDDLQQTMNTGIAAVIYYVGQAIGLLCSEDSEGIEDTLNELEKQTLAECIVVQKTRFLGLLMGRNNPQLIAAITIFRNSVISAVTRLNQAIYRIIRTFLTQIFFDLTFDGTDCLSLVDFLLEQAVAAVIEMNTTVYRAILYLYNIYLNDGCPDNCELSVS